MKRGEIYEAYLDPTEGSEQSGIRPVIIVSRDAINAASTVVLVVPCTTYRLGKRIYPTQVLINAPDGGLVTDSIAMAEQVRALAKTCLQKIRGILSASSLQQLEKALLIAFDLPVKDGNNGRTIPSMLEKALLIAFDLPGQDEWE